MRIAALLAGLGLVAAIVITALASAGGAPAGSVLVRPASAAGPAVPVARLGACSAAGGAGPSSVRLTGPCRGRITGGFSCVRSGEVEALSIRRPLGPGSAFYLTVVIPEYEGPGDYAQDTASAQVIGRSATPRWANLGYGVAIHVTRRGVFELGQAVLLPEPGTSATGVITLSGRAACA